MKKTSKRTVRSRKSSGARPLPGLADVLLAFAAVAGKLELRWYLFGAQAVAIYGVIRTSADVDLTAEVPAGLLRRFVRELATAGFALRVPDSESFIAATRVLPFEHTASVLPVDVVLAGPGLEASFLDRARPVDVGGVSFPVIAPEDLIAGKILAGRPKDLEDIRGILKQESVAIDLALVRTTLAQLEGALDQSDLLPLFDRLVREAKQ